MTTHPVAGAPRPSTEHWRPTTHFTSARSWLNDPNGLIHRDGTWHLFFQTNPHGDSWGEIGWGHATSTDLLSWTEHPLAIAADDQEMVFSGSAVTDRSATGSEIVAVYTSAYRGTSPRTGTQAQSLATSADEGLTWRRHQGNPVLDLGLADFRDPKVFRFAGTDGHWVMVVAFPHEQQIGVFISADLQRWDQQSSFGGDDLTDNIWECPDLVQVPVSGGGHRWIAVVSVFSGGPTGGAGVKYLVGDFDGHRFTPDHAGAWRWVDHGHDYYAAATFNDAPDGRVVALAWASSPHYAAGTPTAPWRGAMTLACDLDLVPEPDGTLALRRTPVLPPDGRGVVVHDISVACTPKTSTTLMLRPADGAGTSHVLLTVDGDEATLVVERVACGLDDAHEQVLASATARVPRTDDLDLRVVVDACVVEIYAAGGLVVLTQLVFPDAPLTELVVQQPAPPETTTSPRTGTRT